MNELWNEILLTFPPQPENAAVMVWIHGGGYHVGAPKGHSNDTLFFAAMGDVIVVTINYRLGMLGFMTTGTRWVPLLLRDWESWDLQDSLKISWKISLFKFQLGVDHVVKCAYINKLNLSIS